MSNFRARLLQSMAFENLPIQKKFFYFAAGVQFWFLVFFCSGLFFILSTSWKSDTLIERYLPQEQVLQRMQTTLQAFSADSAYLAHVSDLEQLEKRAELARSRTRDLYRCINVLTKGGDLQAFSRDNSRVTHTYAVERLAGDQRSQRFVREMLAGTSLVEKEFGDLYRLRVSELHERRDSAGSMAVCNALLSSVGTISSQASDFASALAAERSRYADSISGGVTVAVVVQLALLVSASLLLLMFSRWLAGTFTGPVRSISEQIKELGEGKIDLELVQRLDITQHDEIGVLFHAFNGLMESIKTMSNFKKVIEEDDSVEDVYIRLGAIFVDVIGLDTYRIFEILDDQNTMSLIYPFGLSANDMYCSQDILDNCTQCRAKKTGHNISSMVYAKVCKHYYSEIPKQHVCIPMITGGACCGVVQFIVDTPATTEEYQALDRKLYRAEEFIKESLSVIEAKRLMGTLRDSSLTDALTGLSNRRFLEEQTDALVAGVLRRNKIVGLIMCDMDFFKQVNDTYGHKTGDEVLVQVSKLVRQSVRESDLVIRFGGEEFLVVLLDVTANETVAVAEKIRHNVESAVIRVSDGTVLKKTVSMGTSEFPTDAEVLWQAIKCADKALYRAKETGRNKVVSYTPDMQPDT